MRFAKIVRLHSSHRSRYPQPQPRALVLDNVRIIDGTGAAPIENGRIVIQGERIAAVGPRRSGGAGECRAGRSRRQDRDPRADRSALPHRERSEAGAAAAQPRRHRVPRSRAVEREVRRAAQDDRGRRPARPAHLHDRAAHRRREPRLPGRLGGRARSRRRRAGMPRRTSAQGASALKIYFRLPFGSAKAVIDVCNARRIPCTAHLEILDARRADCRRAARHRAHHVVRRQPACRACRPRPTARPSSATTTRAATAAIACSRPSISTGPRRRRCTPCSERRPWVDADAGRVRAARGQAGRRHERRDWRRCMAAGFAKMKQLTRRAVARRRARRHGRPHRSAVRRPRRSAVARAGAAGRQRLHAARGDHGGHDDRGRLPVSRQGARHACAPGFRPISSCSTATPPQTSRRSGKSSG